MKNPENSKRKKNRKSEVFLNIPCKLKGTNLMMKTTSGGNKEEFKRGIVRGEERIA